MSQDSTTEPTESGNESAGGGHFFSDEHRTGVLYPRAVIDEVIAERGYYSLPGKLAIPLHDVHGRGRGNQYRPDDPTAGKYMRDKGSGNFVDCPPRCQPLLGDPSVPLYITEGPIKADAIASAGGCAIDVFGVYSFRYTNAQGGKVAVGDFEFIALNDRDVLIVPDSDVRTNYRVQRAVMRLERAILSVGRKARIHRIILPSASEGAAQA